MGLGITIGVLATVLLQSVAMTVTDRFTTFIKKMFHRPRRSDNTRALPKIEMSYIGG